MTEVSPATRELAQWLLWHEAGGRLESAVLSVAAECVLNRFRRQLTDLLGQAGFIALFRRALRLAQHEFPALADLALDEKPAEQLLRMRESGIASADDAATVAAALTALIAYLIWLLVTFIGESLTVRLVNEIWPEITRDTWDPSTLNWRDDA